MAKFKRTCQECGYTAVYSARGEKTRCKKCTSTGLDHGNEIDEIQRGMLFRASDVGVIHWLQKLPSVTSAKWIELNTGMDIEVLLQVDTKDYVTCDLLVGVVNRNSVYRIEWVDPCDLEEVTDA